MTAPDPIVTAIENRIAAAGGLCRADLNAVYEAVAADQAVTVEAVKDAYRQHLTEYARAG